MNENIKKFEYYIFIKKIKEKIYVKNQIKTNIILFQKRSALDQLLINVISQMKSNILKEKLRKLLIKKFIYKIMNNYIDRYKSEKSNENQTNIKITSDLLKSKKIAFNNLIIKSEIYSFFEKANICINNTSLKNLLVNYKEEKSEELLKANFQQFKLLTTRNFSSEKKIFMQRIFFKKIKYNILYKSKYINNENKLNNIKRIFIYKNHFNLFLKNYKSNKDKINKINLLKLKIEEFKENKNENKNKEIKYFFNIFIKRAKIMNQTNISLKRKIFNILKNNAIITKELKHYLIEAEKME